MGQVKLSLDSGERSGKLVAELEDVSKSFGDRAIVRGLSLRVMRGDRLGVIGPNGAGKTTLLKLILGTLAPDRGTVRLGTRLVPAYFDQMRAQLDPEATLIDTITPGGEWVELAGGRKHVLSYLGDFLFPPQRANAPVKTLSGGERNRLLLARLFAQPANLLVMDEPTNDLDIDSLELLETTLQSYDGTLLLVSHDRAFLDNVVTQTLVAEGDGHWREYVGGYSDWVAQRARVENAAAAGAEGKAGGKASGKAAGAAAAIAAGAGTSKGDGTDGTVAGAAKSGGAAVEAGGTAARPARTKLSFKEQRELAALPAELEALEQEQHALTALMSTPDYHKRGADAIRADRQRAEAVEHLLAAKFERWAELEARAAPAGR
jgi:ATP-binding cassette subfamily F protein uup